MSQRRYCPDCGENSPIDSLTHTSDDSGTQACSTPGDLSVSRRDFIRTSAAAAALAGTGSLTRPTLAAPRKDAPEPEKLVEELYKSLNDDQRSKVCFDWDHTDNRGLLRTRVENNWSITDAEKYNVGGPFFSSDQQEMIESIFFGMYNREWHDRIRKQLKDDAGGYGRRQTIALFGEPGTDQFEFVMTGRHLTIRCDGDSAEHVAFGGPIFYGHASKDNKDAFNEGPNHPGNVFWPQAQQANKLFEMLDGKQRDTALIKVAPYEDEVGFQGKGAELPGIAISDLSADQKEHAQSVLKTLIEPYRTSDQDEVKKCLEAQGGLDACHLSFYREGDIGEDGVWDIWRLEGPSFVWHFRGSPHVHVWVNVASDPSVKLNASG